MIGINLRIFSHRLAIGMVLACTLCPPAHWPLSRSRQKCTSSEDAILQLHCTTSTRADRGYLSTPLHGLGSEVSSPERAVVLKKSIGLEKNHFEPGSRPLHRITKTRTAAQSIHMLPQPFS